MWSASVVVTAPLLIVVAWGYIVYNTSIVITLSDKNSSQNLTDICRNKHVQIKKNSLNKKTLFS